MCYLAALRVYNERDSPLHWAMTQYNLGNAFRDLPTGDHDDNRSHAIECYRIALRGFETLKATEMINVVSERMAFLEQQRRP